MATGFMNFDTKHAVAESSALKATIAGHIFNIKATADIDNGTIVSKGDYIAPDYYKEGAASSTFAGTIIDVNANGSFLVQVDACAGDLLVLTVPMIYEEYTTQCQHESNFYNAKDDIMRCYELYVGDRFSVSKEGFTGTPAKGKKVKVTAKKLAVQA